MATVALVLGVSSLVVHALAYSAFVQDGWYMASIPIGAGGLLLGNLALRRTDSVPDRKSRAMAITGLTCGALGLTLGVLGVALFTSMSVLGCGELQPPWYGGDCPDIR